MTAKLSDDEYIDEFATQVTQELLKAIMIEQRRLGIDFRDRLVKKLLTTLVSSIVYNDLVSAPPKGEDALAHAETGFITNKTLVEEAMGSAFQAALTVYSGKQVSYYCLIKPMGAPANKLPC